MPVHPPECDFRVDNSPSRAQEHLQENARLVRNPCPNHLYRTCTRRMGQVAKYCALCMNQQEMAERWKNIRKALATSRRFTRKSSSAGKPAEVAAARTHWEISIVRTSSQATVTEGMRLLVVIN